MWVIIFAGGNALLSIAFYFIFYKNNSLSSLTEWSRALVLGVLYVAFARTKTFEFKLKAGAKISVGPELLYDGFKRLSYNSINRLIVRVQYTEACTLASTESLLELTNQVKFIIENNRMLGEEQQRERKEWMLDVLTDPESNDYEKAILFAHYLNCGEASVVKKPLFDN